MSGVEEKSFEAEENEQLAPVCFRPRASFLFCTAAAASPKILPRVFPYPASTFRGYVFPTFDQCTGCVYVSRAVVCLESWFSQYELSKYHRLDFSLIGI